MDSFEKFFEDKLPDKCEFFSSLKDRYISKKDYFNAINVIKDDKELIRLVKNS